MTPIAIPRNRTITVLLHSLAIPLVALFIYCCSNSQEVRDVNEIL